MIGFEKVAQADEITPAYPKRVRVGTSECVLVRIGEKIFAFENARHTKREVCRCKGFYGIHDDPSREKAAVYGE